MPMNFVSLFTVSSDGNRCFGANLSTVDGMVVGAKRTASNSILEHDRSMHVLNGYCCHVLHYVAKCQKVN